VKVVHVITSLATGGAQMMLYKLLSRSAAAGVASEVVSLDGSGPMAARIGALGVPTRPLHMPRGWPNPTAVGRLAAWIRGSGADVCQTWLYHADLVGGLAAKLAGGVPVAWNVRHSILAPSSRRATRATVRACAWMSHWLPARIVCCSEASRRTHVALGYAEAAMTVIPNGFDLTLFRPDPAARAAIDAELGMPADAYRVGLVARFDPQKDHATFLAAATRLLARVPQAHFLLCGAGVEPGNRALASRVAAAGLDGACHLLGERTDVARVTAALDVATSSSITEGFSNTLGEAMACGIPCVATDVGDSAATIGATGRVVAPRDPDGLAAAWHDLWRLGAAGRRQLGEVARARIAAHFDLAMVVRRYADLYGGMLRR